jgi:hypothetical protein
MELGDFKIPGYEEYEKAPKPGQAIVLVPEKQPLPNANTIEGMIEGIGIVASAGSRYTRRRPLLRVFILIMLLMFVLPALVVTVGTFL